jgi:hypothetical protein
VVGLSVRQLWRLRVASSAMFRPGSSTATGDGRRDDAPSRCSGAAPCAGQGVHCPPPG